MVSKEAASSTVEALFAPITIGKLTLRNRFVMPAMQRGFCVNGFPAREMTEIYGRAARGGVALIIAEGTAPPHPSAYWKTTFGRLDDDTCQHWRTLANSVHDNGAKFFIQIWHPGAQRVVPLGSDWAAQPTLSPSGLVKAGLPNGSAMSAPDLIAVREAFVRAALIAQGAGADGIELHAAHGYLLDQFLWGEANRRSDGYGGATLAERARYPAEVVAAIRDAVGRDFVISMRLSNFKEADYDARLCESPDELAAMIARLRAAGVDMFHASARRFHAAPWSNDPRSFAAHIKAVTDAPVVTVGSVGLSTDLLDNLFAGAEPVSELKLALDQLAQGHRRGDFDMVAIGRSLIADPDWVTKVERAAYDQVRTFRRAMLGEAIGREMESLIEDRQSVRDAAGTP